MKKFNKTTAEELVLEFCINHKLTYGGESGLILYSTSGCIGNTNKVLQDHLNFDKFRNSVGRLVSDTFGKTPAVRKWKEFNMMNVIKMSGIKIGGCYIGTDTYTLSYGPLENVIKRTYIIPTYEMDKLESFIETI